MAGRESVFGKPSFPRTFVAVIAAIAALFLIDTFLAKTERAEARTEAARFDKNGRRLLEEGHSAQAVDQFKAAFSNARDNQDYQLALGEALLAAGRLAEAETTLNELLQRNPFSGPANLEMARVLGKEDKPDDAAAYYHRAIYGQWEKNAKANRVKVRFELTDLLSRQDSKEGLLAELLPLQSEAPDDVATRKRLGHLFTAAGSPAQAAAIFRDVLRNQPRDPDAYAGLGEAEFARGNYRTAQNEFLVALRLRPADPDTRERLEVCNRVLELDPIGRGLNLEEQYRRSRNLVELALAGVQQCLGAAASGPAQELIKATQDGLKKPAASRSVALEDNLDWADQLWQVRTTECKHAITEAEKPLALVMAKLAQ